MAKEINLVPDIKDEFIKTLKFRNLVFFLCIVVASGSLIVILIFLSIAGGQQGFINAKKTTLDALEQKINAYSDLSDFLTIRDQLSNIANITDNKVMMSRTFNILSAIIPSSKNADYINISELSVNLAGDAPTFTFDAQADAVTEPFIDYNVLDSFKKSMQYMRYDYGTYVDKYDNEIPAYCIIESDNDGATFKDPSKGYYAFWLINGEGCNPAAEDAEEDEDKKDDEDDTTSNNLNNSSSISTATNLLNTNAQQTATNTSTSQATSGYTIEKYNDNDVVRIWRTPQYTEWYKSNPSEDDAYMDLSGQIHNMAHFNSACISYSGTENDNDTITWSSTNDTCKLVPDDEDGNEGISIEQSSNGRNADEALVLRFSAIITFAPEVFDFNNHHMLALSPASRRNVTDSYSQIQSIFAERAADCEQDDTVCATTPTGEDLLTPRSNSNSSSNSSSSNNSSSSSNSSSNSSGNSNSSTNNNNQEENF